MVQIAFDGGQASRRLANQTHLASGVTVEFPCCAARQVALRTPPETL